VLLGVVSDIHGNLSALDAVLADLEREGADEVVCLGDVAVGPEPRETLARVRGLGLDVVMGNWDAWAIDGFPQARGEPMGKFLEQGAWWAKQLSSSDRAFMRTFLPRFELRFPDVSLLCFHGSPSSYDDMILATTPHEELLDLLTGFDAPLMLGGHTHVQLTRLIAGTLLVNPGSVGLPFRGVAPGEFQFISPWAEYALVRVDDGHLSVDHRRVAYDVENVLRRVIDAGAPHAEWWASTWMTSRSRLPVDATRGDRAPT
jgi:putative phosphoesterase